jgi:hypothetical protein
MTVVLAEEFARMANPILRYGPIAAFRAKLASQMNFTGYQDRVSTFTVIPLWD